MSQNATLSDVPGGLGFAGASALRLQYTVDRRCLLVAALIMTLIGCAVFDAVFGNHDKKWAWSFQIESCRDVENSILAGSNAGFESTIRSGLTYTF
jgi:hypothetical protein